MAPRPARQAPALASRPVPWRAGAAPAPAPAVRPEVERRAAQLAERRAAFPVASRRRSAAPPALAAPATDRSPARPRARQARREEMAPRSTCQRWVRSSVAAPARALRLAVAPVIVRARRSVGAVAEPMESALRPAPQAPAPAPQSAASRPAALGIVSLLAPAWAVRPEVQRAAARRAESPAASERSAVPAPATATPAPAERANGRSPAPPPGRRARTRAKAPSSRPRLAVAGVQRPAAMVRRALPPLVAAKAGRSALRPAPIPPLPAAPSVAQAPPAGTVAAARKAAPAAVRQGPAGADVRPARPRSAPTRGRKSRA